MYLLQSHVMPHPPLIVPAVGGGREKDIQATADACESIAKKIAQARPELIIYITPHGTVYQDYIHVTSGDSVTGDLSRFGAPGEVFNLTLDQEFVWQTEALAKQQGIHAGTLGKNTPLDHGVTVPMHFINKYWRDYKAVCVSVSGLPIDEHYRFGRCLAQSIQDMKRETVIIASGDLSHKLSDDGPYGFAPEGADFDRQLCSVLEQGDFLSLMQFEPTLIQKAAECGLRSFIIMAGAFDGWAVNAQRLSYEGPFGVGYGVFSFYPAHMDKERHFLDKYTQHQHKKMQHLRENESRYVRLARETLEYYIKTNRMPPMPEGLPSDMLTQQAGTFVSIKKDGALRGCIGTTEAYRPNIAEEIRGNAISAGTQDPRFNAITPDELDALTYSVDVLSPAEPIVSRADLDVQRYGVIVTHKNKRGLLLPNLDGVDTVQQQISIALQKAGIASSEDYQLARFEVVRHT
jgi:AmmeMemoRadiSam system protein A/AmmeMemoRadiSam system protein B